VSLAKPFAFALCADDYAMTPGVSAGILEALDAGALTATSVMTTSPWWPESAAALKPHRARADIGLHLNLTLGAPLGPMPRFAPSGVFPSVGALLRGTRTLPLDEIEAEIARQFDAFTSVWGTPPDHVDGHQHVQAPPAIRDLILRQLDLRGLAGRVWLRDSAERPARILARRTTLRKALGVALIARGFSSAARARGYVVNDGFAGFSDFGSTDYGAFFSRYIKSPGVRHLVMCHPGRVDDALRRLDPVTDARERELAFLLSPAFSQRLRASGARLERLSRLPR
jgi:predicted glycoside hydrolase/deacetylase ChbG (UPF0249 family)